MAGRVIWDVAAVLRLKVSLELLLFVLQPQELVDVVTCSATSFASAVWMPSNSR